MNQNLKEIIKDEAGQKVKLEISSSNDITKSEETENDKS